MVMRRLLVGSVSATLLLACGGKKEEAPAAGAKAEAPAAKAEPAAPAEPPAKPIELSKAFDIGAAMMAKDPDDSGWKGITITGPADAKLDVSSGGTMLVIDEKRSLGFGGERDIAEKKANAQKNAEFVRFVVDAPDAILWENKSQLNGQSNFIFIANVKLAEEKTKSCQTDGYGQFDQAAAEKLLEACRGLKFTP